MMLASQKTFDLRGDDIVKLSIENESLKNRKKFSRWKFVRRIWSKVVKTDRWWKKANLILSRMEKQMKKQNWIVYVSCDK